jgi:hypothetical protein
MQMNGYLQVCDVNGERCGRCLASTGVKKVIEGIGNVCGTTMAAAMRTIRPNVDQENSK